MTQQVINRWLRENGDLRPNRGTGWQCKGASASKWTAWRRDTEAEEAYIQESHYSRFLRGNLSKQYALNN
jgi:hypothetical protein